MSPIVNANLCFVVSRPMTARVFLAEHLLALGKCYDVDLVCDLEGGHRLEQIEGRIGIVSVAIKRKVSPAADFAALLSLYCQFRSKPYAVACSMTPKAGLLSLLASFCGRVPVRIHIFTGQVWVTRSGVKRWLLKMIDKLMACLATDLLADSPSQREFLIAEGVVRPEKIQVLAGGSICGVDVERFRARPGMRDSLRQELGIPEDAVVVLFLGRMNRDKGVLDLARAYADLAVKNQGLWLLAVGPDEEKIQANVAAICAEVSSRTRLLGFTDQPERFMVAADIFALPSYREGFGSSVIEAAACGVPSVCSRIYGLTDAVVDGVTGVLHTPADVTDIKIRLEQLLDPSLRERLGEAARNRAVNEFSQQRLTDGMLSFIESCLVR